MTACTLFLQRLAIQAFLRGSSVVVSAPTSSGKTLIAESAAVATVARGRRLFYTTPLKALSNQKFREFRYVKLRLFVLFLLILGHQRVPILIRDFTVRHLVITMLAFLLGILQLTEMLRF